MEFGVGHDHSLPHPSVYHPRASVHQPGRVHQLLSPMTPPAGKDHLSPILQRRNQAREVGIWDWNQSFELHSPSSHTVRGRASVTAPNTESRGRGRCTSSSPAAPGRERTGPARHLLRSVRDSIMSGQFITGALPPLRPFPQLQTHQETGAHVGASRLMDEPQRPLCRARCGERRGFSLCAEVLQGLASPHITGRPRAMAASGPPLCPPLAVASSGLPHSR